LAGGTARIDGPVDRAAIGRDVGHGIDRHRDVDGRIGSGDDGNIVSSAAIGESDGSLGEGRPIGFDVEEAAAAAPRRRQEVRTQSETAQPEDASPEFHLAIHVPLMRMGAPRATNGARAERQFSSDRRSESITLRGFDHRAAPRFDPFCRPMLVVAISPGVRSIPDLEDRAIVAPALPTAFRCDQKVLASPRDEPSASIQGLP
jgi:hypothetical protein